MIYFMTIYDIIHENVVIQLNFSLFLMLDIYNYN